MAKTTTPPDLQSVFNKVRDILVRHADGLTLRNGAEDKIELSGKKKINYLKKDIDGIFFAAAMKQKNFVGFYYFPIYTHTEHLSIVPPELTKCLKGKSCFHIKKDDPLLLKQIDDLIAEGKKFYRSLGFI